MNNRAALGPAFAPAGDTEFDVWVRLQPGAAQLQFGLVEAGLGGPQAGMAGQPWQRPLVELGQVSGFSQDASQRRLRQTRLSEQQGEVLPRARQPLLKAR